MYALPGTTVEAATYFKLLFLPLHGSWVLCLFLQETGSKTKITFLNSNCIKGRTQIRIFVSQWNTGESK
jgi:hypothetical protein